MTPTAAGYALMTQMAEVAILSTLGQAPGGGLSTEHYGSPNANTDTNPFSNVNSITAGNALQFTPYGWYNNNPLVAPFVNATFAGPTGTWTSSNPLVMYCYPDRICVRAFSGNCIHHLYVPNRSEI